MPHTTTLSDSLLEQISDVIASRTGLYYSRDRWRDLKRGLTASANASGYKDIDAYIRNLLSSTWTQVDIGELAGYLTVGETYFFREPKPLKALETHILPELIRSRQAGDRRLRIWSVACSSGEEPYTIAMMLDTMLFDLSDWNVTILATDINPSALHKASSGVYSQWSMRAIPPLMAQRYFTRNPNGEYLISPEIKRMVTFSCLNLADNTYPSFITNTNAMDIILCRNVLIYFDDATVRFVVDHMHRSLTEEGWLIVSAAELSHTVFSSFDSVKKDGAILYKKKRLSLEHTDATVAVPLKRERFEPPKKKRSTLPIPKPSDAETAYRQAVEWYEDGRYEQAREYLLSTMSREESYGPTMALLSRAFADRGDLEEANAYCQRAIATDKLNPEYQFLLATIVQEQGHIDQAIRIFEKVLYLDGAFVLAYVALNTLTRQRGEYKKAIKYSENAIDLLKTYPDEACPPESEGMTAGHLRVVLQSTPKDH